MEKNKDKNKTESRQDIDILFAEYKNYLNLLTESLKNNSCLSSEDISKIPRRGIRRYRRRNQKKKVVIKRRKEIFGRRQMEIKFIDPRKKGTKTISFRIPVELKDRLEKIKKEVADKHKLDFDIQYHFITAVELICNQAEKKLNDLDKKSNKQKDGQNVNEL